MLLTSFPVPVASEIRIRPSTPLLLTSCPVTERVASDAMVRLAQFRDTPVIAYQIGPTCLAVIFIQHTLRDIAFVQAFVVMEQDGRNIETIRTRHTIFAVVARDLFST